jgi:hypothetical protein
VAPLTEFSRATIGMFGLTKVRLGVPSEWAIGKSELIDDFSSVVLRLETTNQCNFKCTFCPHPIHKRERLFLNAGLGEKVLREARDAGFRILDLRNFGEPLVDKRLPQFAATASRLGYNDIYIHTNGYGLTADRLGVLVSAGVTRIIVSLSPRREFETTRPGKSFDRLLRDMGTLRTSTHRDKVVIDHIDTGASTRLEIEEMRTRLDDIGLVLRTRIDLHNWASGQVDVDLERILCHRLWTSFTVLSNGQVALCCLDYEGDIVVGDVNVQTIGEIVNGPLYREIRAAHLAGEFLDKCAACDMPIVKDAVGSGWP